LGWTKRPIYLLGFMGCGKSSIGRELAAQTGRAFVDTDTVVEETAGRTIERIFRESGEGHFRELEWSALRALESRERIVVATGGGLFLGLVQRRFMKSEGTTVWIDVPLDVLRARLASDSRRPLFAPEDALSFRALYEKRRAVYALADVRILGWPGDPIDLARRIVERVRPLPH
jgi:shikimate kinase